MAISLSQLALNRFESLNRFLKVKKEVQVNILNPGDLATVLCKKQRMEGLTQGTIEEVRLELST
ncbi:hypothetical protein DPV73_15355 [Leptospira mayottensis]|nr:hypothetical protein DPV73_15355 [Leptospira mayottensis]